MSRKQERGELSKEFTKQNMALQEQSTIKNLGIMDFKPSTMSNKLVSILNQMNDSNSNSVTKTKSTAVHDSRNVGKECHETEVMGNGIDRNLPIVKNCHEDFIGTLTPILESTNETLLSSINTEVLDKACVSMEPKSRTVLGSTNKQWYEFLGSSLTKQKTSTADQCNGDSHCLEPSLPEMPSNQNHIQISKPHISAASGQFSTIARLPTEKSKDKPHANTSPHISVVWDPISWKQGEKSGSSKKEMQPLKTNVIHPSLKRAGINVEFCNQINTHVHHNATEHLTPSQDLFQSITASAVVNNAQIEQSATAANLSSSKRLDDLSQSLFHSEATGGNLVTDKQASLKLKEALSQSPRRSRVLSEQTNLAGIVNAAPNAVTEPNLDNCLDVTQVDYSLTYPAALDEADINTQLPASLLDCGITQPNFKLTYPSFLAEMDSEDLMSKTNQHCAVINNKSTVIPKKASEIDRPFTKEQDTMKALNTKVNLDETTFDEDSDLVPDLECKHFPLAKMDDNVVPDDFHCINSSDISNEADDDDHFAVPLSKPPPRISKAKSAAKEKVRNEEHQQQSQNALVPSMSYESYPTVEPKSSTDMKCYDENIREDISITQLETNILELISDSDHNASTTLVAPKKAEESIDGFTENDCMRKEDENVLVADQACTDDIEQGGSEDLTEMEVDCTRIQSDDRTMIAADVEASLMGSNEKYASPEIQLSPAQGSAGDKVLSPDSQPEEADSKLCQDEKQDVVVGCKEKVVPETQPDEVCDSIKNAVPMMPYSDEADGLDTNKESSRKVYDTQDYLPGQYGCGLIDRKTQKNSVVDDKPRFCVDDSSNMIVPEMPKPSSFYLKDAQPVEPIYPEQCVPDNMSGEEHHANASQDEDSDYSETEDTQVNFYPSEMLNFDQSLLKRKPMPQISFHYERVVPDPVDYTCTRKRRVGLSRRYCVSTALHQEVGAAKRYRMVEQEEQHSNRRMHVDNNTEYY